jgi:deoxyribose-phosphate aldolase
MRRDEAGGVATFEHAIDRRAVGEVRIGTHEALYVCAAFEERANDLAADFAGGTGNECGRHD